MQRALLYREPSIIVILTLTSFLLLLNFIGYLLDRLIFCGLVGQILIGVAWGSPGGRWLPVASQDAFVELGYLGLILLVFEGGLSTNFPALKSNLFLSISVALTGIGATVGISFVLMELANATPLQAFGAGAALCSTSLGTTFSVLKTSGLTQSRLGVVLASAAMLDDIVGLVMVQIISNLGVNESSFSASIVVRPIGVSVAFAIGVPLICRFVIKPLDSKLQSFSARPVRYFTNKTQMAFLIHSTILISLIVGSSFAGTSNLFAAYLAGACISWYDLEVINTSPQPLISNGLTGVEETVGANVNAECEKDNSGHPRDTRVHRTTGSDEVHSTANDHSKTQVSPSPTASIRYDSPQRRDKTRVHDHLNGQSETQAEPSMTLKATSETRPQPGENTKGTSVWMIYYDKPVSAVLKPLFFASIGFSIPISQIFTGLIVWRGLVYSVLMIIAKLLCGAWLIRLSTNVASSGSDAPKQGSRLPRPISLYPASILGCAMVARGEIGFLISAIAESSGIFSSTAGDETSDLFLIVTWAIMLCTIAGPIAVGLITRRVRRLQEMERGRSGGREDPLGIWGVK